MVCVTLRWRKPDSNHRYRMARSRFPEGLTSSLLDFLPTEKLARTRTDTTTMPRALRGTDGSNPVPSSGESVSAVNSGAVGEKPGAFAPVCTANGTREGDELAEHPLIWPFLSEGH